MPLGEEECVLLIVSVVCVLITKYHTLVICKELDFTVHSCGTWETKTMNGVTFWHLVRAVLMLQSLTWERCRRLEGEKEAFTQ